MDSAPESNHGPKRPHPAVLHSTPGVPVTSAPRAPPWHSGGGGLRAAARRASCSVFLPSAPPSSVFGGVSPGGSATTGPVGARHRPVHAVRVRVEVVGEHACQPRGGAIVRGRVSPRRSWIQETGPATFGHVVGTSKPKTGSTRIATPTACPSSAARTIDRVWAMFIRSPVPYGPPVQPVLTSQTGTSSRSRRSISMCAYSPGWRGMNGAPKHAEKVAFGSLIPTSVPASLAV